MKLPHLTVDELPRGRSLPESVAQIIREEITSGRLDDGERLPHESELIKHFGISRPTLREALRILQSEGVLHVGRGNGGGARVSTPQPGRIAGYAAVPLRMRRATMQDMLEIRRLIEPTAIARLARTQNQETIAKLAQIAVAQRYVTKDREAYRDLEFEFCQVLLENCDSEPLRLFGLMLDELIRAQWDRVIKDLPKHKYEQVESQYAANQKLKIVDLISAGKDSDAEAEWITYIENFEKGLLRHGGPHMLL